MRNKKITAVVLIVIGIIIFILAMYAKSRVSEAKGNVKKTSGMFSNNPVNKQISDVLERKVSSYDAPILWMTIGGIVVALIGVGVLCSCKKKR